MNETVAIRLISFFIGYFFGCILTGEIVAYRYTGGSASRLGDTGNPGMANIMAALGFKPGIQVLLGDLLKCFIAMLIAWRIYGMTGVLYAGLGSTVGHDFPFWRKFRGGKGVATSSLAFIMYSFPLGVFSNIVGMLVVFATQYLCIGGLVIPVVFTIGGWLLFGREVGLVGIAYILLALRSHLGQIMKIPSGECAKDDVIGAIRKKWGKRS